MARSTASGHLGRLADAGLLRVETHGRHRYYRLAGADVGELLEKPTQMAPPRPVRSLREGNRAQQLRAARTCYDHLAGRLGVSLMAALIDRGFLAGGDGGFHPERGGDSRSGYGRDVDYALTPAGRDFLDGLGLRVPEGNRSLLRYCVDWSEQRHHLAGMLGRALLDHFLAEDWVRRRASGRSLEVTEAGRAALDERFHAVWP